VATASFLSWIDIVLQAYVTQIIPEQSEPMEVDDVSQWEVCF
jgi:hypothetical protein